MNCHGKSRRWSELFPGVLAALVCAVLLMARAALAICNTPEAVEYELEITDQTIEVGNVKVSAPVYVGVGQDVKISAKAGCDTLAVPTPPYQYTFKFTASADAEFTGNATDTLDYGLTNSAIIHWSTPGDKVVTQVVFNVAHDQINPKPSDCAATNFYNVTVLSIDLDGDMNLDGSVDGADPDDDEEFTPPGLVVPLNDNDDNSNDTVDHEELGPLSEEDPSLAKITVTGLPDSLSQGKVVMEAINLSGNGRVKVWSDKLKGYCLLDSGAPGSAEWILGSTVTPTMASVPPPPATPHELWVEGKNESSEAGSVQLRVRYEYPAGTVICADTVTVTVVKMDIRGDFNHDGNIDDLDLNDASEQTAPGLIVSVGGNKVRIKLSGLPADLNEGEVRLTAVAGSGTGQIKVWNAPVDGELVLDSAAAAPGETMIWTIGSESTPTMSAIPVNLWIEGSGASGAIGDVELTLSYKRSASAVSNYEHLDKLAITVIKVELVPDFNHDRVIDDTDKTELADKGPFRFWINDDADDGYEGSHIPGAPGLPIQDCHKMHVSGQSDLIDYFPVWLGLKQALNMMAPDDGYEYKLKQANAGVKVVYTDLTKNNAGSFQIDKTNSACGPNFNQTSYRADTMLITAAGVPLSLNFLSKIKNDETKGVLMVEGVNDTDTPLILEVWKSGAKIVQWEMLLSVHGVEKMYRHLNLRWVTGGGGGRVTETNNPANYPASLCINKDVVVLHGVNVDGEAARAWHAEMFKRLYWTGSKARFHGITYNSNAGLSSANYQENVKNAFVSSSNVSEYVKTLPGSKIIISHSMGNIVVCNAIQDYDMVVDKYFMLDSAVASEAIKESYFYEATNNNVMLSPDWKHYHPRTWASKWHELFLSYPSDDRAQLTWRSRFIKVANLGAKVCNLYTSEDQCLDIFSSVPGFWDGAALDASWSGVTATLDHYVWHKQEVFKGTDFLIFGIGSTHYAGWGFRNFLGIRAYSAAEANNLSDPNLRTACVFRPDPSGMFSSTITRQLQNEILAKGIPALSFPVGHAEVNVQGFVSINMVELKPDDWPRNHPQYNQKWLHSDIKDMAYLYVNEAFEKFVSLGGLK